jgi:hypothetical protein
MKLLDLNIFTNCTEYNSDNAFLVSSAFNSWCDAFDVSVVNNVNILINPRPNIKKYKTYRKSIRNFFLTKDIPFKIHRSKSLSYSYVTSTKVSETEYIFQLEHDWVFVKDSINHSLEEIISAMKKKKIEHLRFNKRENIKAGWDKSIKEVVVDGLPLCATPIRSNCPHIIERQAYLDKWNNHIKISKGTRGIEDRLRRAKGCIYGGLNHPRQIDHVNGDMDHDPKKKEHRKTIKDKKMTKQRCKKRIMEIKAIRNGRKFPDF